MSVNQEHTAPEKRLDGLCIVCLVLGRDSFKKAPQVGGTFQITAKMGTWELQVEQEVENLFAWFV